MADLSFEPVLRVGGCLSLLAQWIWRPIFAPAQILVVIGILIGLSAWLYARTTTISATKRLVLVLMRVSGLLALAVIMLGPSELPREIPRAERAELTIVVDVSDSMLTEDCQGRSRLVAARDAWLNENFLSQLNELCYLDGYGFAEQLVPLALDEEPLTWDRESAGHRSYVGRSVLQSVKTRQSRRPGLVLVLSDGHDSEDLPSEAVASVARARNVPVHAVCFGRPSDERDLTLIATPLQDYLLPGESGAILVKAFQFGLPTATTTVRLTSNGQTHTVPLAFNGRSVVELQLPIRQDAEGQYEYQVSLDPVTDEIETKNNRQSVFCQVQERRIRVLLLEGQPYWDTKFLAQSLRKDERIELTQITQVSADNRETILSRAQQATAAVPNSAEQWAAYDVIILGSQLQQVLSGTQGEQLRDYVRDQGGQLVFARGCAYDRSRAEGRTLARSLGLLEPVEWDDQFTTAAGVQLVPGMGEASWLATSKLGVDAAEVWRELPGFEGMQRVKRVKPAARVYASTTDSSGATEVWPAVAGMQVGRGQTLTLLGQGSWRWSLRPPSAPGQLSFYDAFWSNLVRWLMYGSEFQPSQQVALTLSRQSVRLGDEVTAELVFKDPAAAVGPRDVVWIQPDGRRTSVQLTPVPGRTPRFRATLLPEQGGVHQLQLETPGLTPERQEQKFNVYDVDLERLEVSARPDYLRRLAEATGGRLLPADRPEELLGVIHRQQTARQVPQEPEYVWDRGVCLFGLLCWLGAEWLLRRGVGLL